MYMKANSKRHQVKDLTHSIGKSAQNKSYQLFSVKTMRQMK